jgi:hypothetical protein
VAVVMARFTPTIPIATLSRADPKFSVSTDDWQRIEAAYGFELSTEVREQIHRATLKFLLFIEAEQTARPMVEAREVVSVV